MFIECNNCSAIVDAKELGEKVYGPDDYGDPRKYVLLECPQCDSALLGFSEIEPGENGKWEFRTASRSWPEPSSDSFHLAIPREVRKSLKDAKKCYRSQVFSATAVMCGKAIESICKDKTGAKTIAKGLEKMKKEGIIDEKIWNWADALRKERNLGAHATGYDKKKKMQKIS